METYARDLLDDLIRQDTWFASRMAQGSAGFEGCVFKPEYAGAQRNFEKVVNLPGRKAIPSRLQLWRTLRSNRTLFDVSLRASDREVLCNAHVLAEESAFFLAEFANPDFGGSQKVVHLESIKGDTLETVVAALYNATIKLNRDNIERFLHCADMLQLSAVKDACCQYMKDCLGKDTAVATLLLAAKFSCKDVHVHAQSYIAGTFHTMRPDALKECPRPIFWDLISRNDLSVNSELQVLTAITVWCDRNGREAFLGLLPAVRIDQLYVHELEVMAQHAMVLEHPAALDQVHAALAAAYSPDNPQRNPQWGPRMPREKLAKALPRRVGSPTWAPTYYPQYPNYYTPYTGMGNPSSYWAGLQRWQQERARDQYSVNLAHQPHHGQPQTQNLDVNLALMEKRDSSRG